MWTANAAKQIFTIAFLNQIKLTLYNTLLQQQQQQQLTTSGRGLSWGRIDDLISFKPTKLAINCKSKIE